MLVKIIVTIILTHTQPQMQPLCRSQTLDFPNSGNIAPIDGGSQGAIDSVHLHADVDPEQERFTRHLAQVIPAVIPDVDHQNIVISQLPKPNRKPGSGKT